MRKGFQKAGQITDASVLPYEVIVNRYLIQSYQFAIIGDGTDDTGSHLRILRSDLYRD